jgi:hypothetical protein
MSEDVEVYGTDLRRGAFANGTGPLTRLCALDRLFAATGTVEVKVGTRTVIVPIRAVSNEDVEALMTEHRPVPPTRSQLENGKRIIIENQADPSYQGKLVEYNRLSSYAYVLLALDIDVLDAQEHVVWSADNRVHDLDNARQALKSMGLVDNQLVTILTAASALTRTEEGERVSD